MKPKIKPKEAVCPKCDIEGFEYIVSKGSVEQSKIDEPWFDIVYCSNCGHVYGVFNKIVLRPVVQFDYQKK